MTKKELILIIACFVQGSFLSTMYYYHVLENEAWITLIGGILVGVLLVCLYNVLCKTYQGLSLVQINEAVFGKIPGKIISLVYVYSFFISCSRMLRESSQFVASNLLMGTDWVFILFVFVILCALAANSGIRFFTSVSTVLCIVMYLFTVLSLVLLIPQGELRFFMPMGEAKIAEYLRGLSLCTAIPFSQLVMLLMVTPELRDNNGTQNNLSKGVLKEFLLGLLVGTPFLLIIVFRDTFVLGPLIGDISYPGYEVTRLINYNIFSNIESLYGAFLIFLMFFKIAIIFFCIIKALSQIFNARKSIVFSAFTAGLLMLGAQSISNSNIELINIVINRLSYVLLAVQIGIPVLTIIVSKIRSSIQYKRGDVKCG